MQKELHILYKCRIYMIGLAETAPALPMAQQSAATPNAKFNFNRFCQELELDKYQINLIKKLLFYQRSKDVAQSITERWIDTNLEKYGYDPDASHTDIIQYATSQDLINKLENVLPSKDFPHTDNYEENYLNIKNNKKPINYIWLWKMILNNKNSGFIYNTNMLYNQNILNNYFQDATKILNKNIITNKNMNDIINNRIKKIKNAPQN